MASMSPRSSSRSDGRAWKARRRKAEQLFEAGERQSTVARQLGISRQCVHNWFWEWQGADAAFRGLCRSASGRKAKLTLHQLAAVDEALRRGPQAFGFASERWTLWRIAVVIERTTGVHYHPSSVWRILRILGWTLRLPLRRSRRCKAYVPRHWAAPAKSVFEE
jgi:transposase